MVVALFIVNFRRSTTGLAVNAARWSEAGARTSGISVVQMKVISGALAALIAGIGGGLLVLAQTTFEPSEFATFAGVVWLAVLVTIGVRSNAAALVAGLAFVMLPALTQAYLPSWTANLIARALRSGCHFGRQVSRWGPCRAEQAIPAFAAPSDDRRPKWPALRRRRDQCHRCRVPVIRPPRSLSPSRDVDPEPVAGSGGRATRPRGGRDHRPFRRADGALQRLSRGRTGNIAGLVGPNGAGKSTLLAVLSGLLRPNAGHVRLRGEDVTNASAQSRADGVWPGHSNSQSCSWD